MLIELFLIVLVVYLAIKYIQFNNKFKDFSKIPGPRSYPVIGNVLEFETNPVGIFNSLKRLTREHGPFFKYWLGSFGPNIVVAGKEHVEFFLSSKEHIDKSANYNLLQPWLGQGLLVANGVDFGANKLKHQSQVKVCTNLNCSCWAISGNEEIDRVYFLGNHWRNHRKMLTPTFHFKILEQYVPIFSNCWDSLIEKLRRQVEKEMDVYPFINLSALDSICETAMGIKIDETKKSNKQYVESLHDFLDYHMERTVSVVKKNAFLVRFTKVYGEQMRHIKVLRTFVEDAIAKRKRERKSEVLVDNSTDNLGQKKKLAFLDLLLDLADKNFIAETDVREEVDTFMFAGHDTVSATLSLALYELAKHPDIQKFLLEEINMEIPSGDPTHKHLQGLMYMDAVLKEVLRLHTVVPIIERQLRKDVVLDGLKLPAGTTIIINIEDLHHSEDCYEEPYVFKPERFFADECAKRHPYAFVPFSAGPRNCIGQKFAMLSMKVALVKIIRNFEILPVAGFVPKLGNNVVLNSFNGVYIRLKKR